MTPYLDSLLNRMDDRSQTWGAVSTPGYREGLGEDAEQAATNAIVGTVPVAAQRNTQLEALDKRIAELKDKIANWNGGEGALARYRFVYENDPSLYTNRINSLRSHEQAKEMADINHRNAMELQKASQQKTDRQQALDAWKQNSIDLDSARYTLAKAKQDYQDAVNSNDADAIRKAGLELQRAKGIYNRNLRENENLRGKVGQFMGFQDKPKEETLDLDDTQSKDVKNAEDFTRDKGDVERIVSKPDNMAVSKKQKQDYIDSTNMKLNYFEDKVKRSTMSQKQKNDLLAIVDQKRRELAEYAKPAKKGGQSTLKNTGDWVKAVSGKTRAQLEAMSDADLKATVRDFQATGTAIPSNLAEILDKKGIVH